jgi:hypothetical protein
MAHIIKDNLNMAIFQAMESSITQTMKDMRDGGYMDFNKVMGLL